MTTINDGGPAFPVAPDDNSGPTVTGMTLRDWFAGQAMKAILSHSEWQLLFRSNVGGPPRWNGYAIGKHGETHVEARDALSKLSYEAADAMIAARTQVAR